MALRRLLALLLSHPRFGPQLINKIADSWPIRRAAKLTAAAYLRGRHAVEQKMKNVGNQEQHSSHKQCMGSKENQRSGDINLDRFKQSFMEELKKGWDQAKRDAIKKDNRKP